MTAIKRIAPPELYDLGIPFDYALNGTNWNTGMTPSLLSSWTFCRYMFLININRYRRPDKVFTTGFGTMFHDILNRTYHTAKEYNEFPSYLQVKKWIGNWEDKIEIAYKSSEQIEKELLIAEVLMKEYLEFYSKDIETFKVISLEEVVDEQFHEFRIRGKIDAVLFLKLNKFYYTFEHKTKGEIVEEIIKKILTFDAQNLFYITAKERQDYKRKYGGTIYNIVRNPRHKLKKGESLKSFKRRLRLDVEGRPHHFFVRFTQPYSQETKDIFRIELLAKLRDIQKFLDKETLQYKNETACHRKWACEHLNACSSGKLIGYMKADKLFSELEEEENGIEKRY